MEQNFIKYISEFFRRLIEVYNFEIKTEKKEGQSYMIEFISNGFVIKIEKYFQEFYSTLYKINKQDSEINLFNLLEYLKQRSEEIPSSEYFRKERDIDECYRKQLSHISTLIYANIDVIADFFNEAKYELNVIEFEKYWKSKHPELYNKA
jgi:hypothetical protein